jgi:hypothetical protein
MTQIANYYYDLPDDINIMIENYHHNINIAFQKDFLTHKKAFSGIMDFILRRCCVGVCCNEGTEYVDEGYDEYDDGEDTRYCVMICDVCAPDGIDDPALVALYENNLIQRHYEREYSDEDRAVQRPENENTYCLYLLNSFHEPHTRCSCKWVFDDKSIIHCEMCNEIEQDPMELIKTKYETYKKEITDFLKSTPNVKQPKLGGLTVEEYVLKYAVFSDERFIGWEDERLEKYIEPWAYTFTSTEMIKAKAAAKFYQSKTVNNLGELTGYTLKSIFGGDMKWNVLNYYDDDEEYTLVIETITYRDHTQYRVLFDDNEALHVSYSEGQRPSIKYILEEIRGDYDNDEESSEDED